MTPFPAAAAFTVESPKKKSPDWLLQSGLRLVSASTNWSMARWQGEGTAEMFLIVSPMLTLTVRCLVGFAR